MTSPESEDTPRPDATGPDAAARDRGPTGPVGPPGTPQPVGPVLPDDVDAAFAAIVASWAATDAPRWPDGPADPPGGDLPGAGPTDGEPAAGVGLETPPSGAPRPELPADPPDPPAPPAPADPPTASDEAHFVPPEPPPLPRIGASSLVGLLLLVVGVVLLAVPGLVGDALGLGIVPGLLAMTAGLGWLVLGLRRPSDDDPGPDGRGVL